jgi:hypothetical protein
MAALARCTRHGRFRLPYAPHVIRNFLRAVGYEQQGTGSDVSLRITPAGLEAMKKPTPSLAIVTEAQIWARMYQ